MDFPSTGAFQLEGKGVRMAAITDGTSNTLLAGEKHVPIQAMGQGWLDSSTYNGDYPICWARGAGMGIALARSLKDTGWKFGSYHTTTCQFAFCDGSVRGLPNTLSPSILELLANRSDGQVVPEY